MNISIKALENSDYAQWLPLWDANNLGHHDDAVTKETWARMNSAGYPVFGIGAFDEHKLVGILHYVLHPTTGSVKLVGYMQDLYVDPAYRGKGFARALVQELSNIGKEQNLARFYWLAEAKNEAAQKLYKSLGVKLDFTLHVLPV